MRLHPPKVLFSLVFSLFLVLLIAPTASYADIIQLKNGNAIETKILKEAEEFIVVEAPGGKVKIPKNDIQMIWRGDKGEFFKVRGKEMYFAKGVELYKQGHFMEAAENFEQASASDAGNVVLYVNLGSAYASAGEAEKAKENFLKALAEKPNDPDILLNLAHLCESQKDFKPAIQYYLRFLTLHPDDANAKRSLAYCEYMVGDYSDAASLFEALGQKNDAVALCNSAAAYIQAGELGRASKILDQLLENPLPVPRTYFLMAEVSRLRKDYSGAEDYYEKALKQDPDVAKVKAGLGWLYLNRGEWSKAEAAFGQAQAEDPGSFDAARGLAQLCIQKGEFEKAIAQYDALAKKDPENPVIISSIGLIYLKMNRPEVALEHFNKILVQNDRDAKAHTNAGLAYALMNDADNALKEWNRALELDPKLEPALQNKKLLEEAMQGSENGKTTSK